MKRLFFVALILATGMGSIFAEETPAGIYVGILSFSDNLKPLTTPDDGGNSLSFFSLNEPLIGDARLKKAINDYAVTDDKIVGGTALYYAINKAVADLKSEDRGGKLPKDTDSVYIITITDDGYDNASADKLRANNGFPRELSYSEELRLDDSAFIRHILRDTRINGKEIQTYFLAMDNAEQFNSIATESSKVEHPLNLSGRLAEITRQIGTENEQMVFTANFSRPRSGTRIRFQIDKNDPRFWIEGTVEIRGGKYDITDITSSKSNTSAAKELYKQGSISAPIEEGSENRYLSFNFTLNGAFAEGTTGKMFRYTATGTPREDTEVQLRVYKPVNAEEFKNRTSAVVYFLLDNSRSMEKHINVIKTSLTDSIEYFTKLNTGAAILTAAPDLNNPDSGTATAPVPISREVALRQWNNFIAEDKRSIKPMNGSLFRQDFFPRSSVDWGQSATINEPYYYVQIVAASRQTDAEELYQALKNHLPGNSTLLHENGYYKVCIGPLNVRNSGEAGQLAADMRQAARAAL